VDVALRGAILVWKTTLKTATRRLAGRPPVLVVAIERKQKYVRRVEELGPGHLVYDRLHGGKQTRLTRVPEGPTAQQ
jgi:hypothetical protein